MLPDRPLTDAEKRAACRAHGLRDVDFVVSFVPASSLPEAERERVADLDRARYGVARTTVPQWTLCPSVRKARPDLVGAPGLFPTDPQSP